MLIPFTQASVPEINFDAGTLRVDPHAAGLIDDGDNGHAAPRPGSKKP